MHNFTVTIKKENYMFRLQCSHNQAVSTSNLKGNCIPVFDIWLQINGGRDLDLSVVKGT
jgi:hypothetical protein